MIIRLVAISLFLLSGCVTAKQTTPFNISVSRDSSNGYDLLFKLKNITNSNLEIDISSLSINTIEFNFSNTEGKINFKKMVPIEDYIKKSITIKPNTFFEKVIPLSSYYPELSNELKKNDLKMTWSSKIFIYENKNTRDLSNKYDVKGEISLTGK